MGFHRRLRRLIAGLRTVERRRRIARIEKTILRRYHGVVQSGPFAGMIHTGMSAEGCLAPKLIGTYERELHPYLERLLQTPYERVVNVGCAEGYYAIGLALRLPMAHVYAFDENPAAVFLCKEMARVNKVTDRITVMGKCTSGQLSRYVRPRSLLIVDCEGCEVDIIDPQRVGALQVCDMVTELHDFVHPDVLPTLLARVQSSHLVAVVRACIRLHDDPPALRFLSERERRDALDERRPDGMAWLVATASDRPDGS